MTRARGTAEDDARCVHCGHAIGRTRVFVLAGERHCLRCALRDRRLPRRSALTALVVGTALVGINHGPILLAGDFPLRLFWQIPLTYVVPFCVATRGALGNSRVAPP